MAYQDTSLILAQPVKNNLYLAAPPEQRPAFWRRKRWARRVLAEFDLDIELFPDAPAGALTLADRQLFEVAKALVIGPDGAAPGRADHRPRARTRSRRCTARVAACRARGVGVVYVSHRLPEVLEIADRVTVLRDGRNQGRSRRARPPRHELVELIVGRPFEAAFPPAGTGSRAERGEVLVVDGLQGQSFGPVSFTLESRRDRRDRGRRGQRPAAAVRLPGRAGSRHGRPRGLRRQGAVADLHARGGARRGSCCCRATAGARP